jgi:superfamily II DNA or RNA helicase
MRKVVSCEYIDDVEDTYNLHIKTDHNYIVNDVVVSNCHLAKGNVISSILNQLVECPHKVGLTGTLSADESKVSELQLVGLFGPVHKTITTRELIDNGNIADMRIESLLLSYPDEDKQNCKKLTYQQEIDWLTTHPKRNFFLSKLVSLQKGNTIILFNFIKHGKDLLERIKELCPDRPVYYISGEVDGDEREVIRQAMEDHDDAIIVGNISVIGTGVSIKKLHSMILAHPTKSRIRTLQAVGRMLRKHTTKTKAVVYDIADDLQWKKRKNYGLGHYTSRIKYYAQEKLDYTMKKIRIG